MKMDDFIYLVWSAKMKKKKRGRKRKKEKKQDIFFIKILILH
jgi:hypothetical protein